ncbi:SusC/RagA family TonB-linked outer membrane protein [Flavivirga abyssicola]|uniref:SusC/RagA family TonB-linked outer membrane protein n=1 Tax=Flavivirga abyssicola TaxID=3063533 RepID=UPI0026E0B2AD|nr:SusC/RagA family TonB-linked outer membrane protein [Flavivirga sp. MEBiC07777]WVK14076.1 SusC/RagA family TonB-linked outer membrane protein [Flavivirga sp. MEBiC07777]
MKNNQRFYDSLLDFRNKTLFVMKSLTVFLVLFSLYSFSNSYSQSKKLRIEIKEATLMSMIESIENQSEFVFIYNDEVLPELKKALGSIQIKNKSIYKVLDRVLNKKRLSYSINERQVILNKKEVNLQSNLQQQISGTITGTDGLPLPGVNIIIEGSSRGAQTDFNGIYAINASEGDILKISFIGMKTQFVTVGSSNVIDIVMEEDLEDLDEVIITGYQNVRRELFTGASQTIKAEEVKLDGVADISRSLEGRAAGVSVQNVTGTFGAAPRITIRGSSSILGDTKPIWIIDGVIQEEIVNLSVSDLVSGDPNTLLSSAVAGLNATDIQSFEILRDASATALYGARALNGVVVITTKSGKKNQKPTFNYAAEFAIRDIPRYENYDLLNSQETVSVYRELEAKGFLDLPTSFQGRFGGIYNIMYRAINNFDESTGQYELQNTPEARARFLQQFELANTDWFKTLFRTTPTQTHTLSYSGGGENSTSYASLGYYTDGGWTIADRVRRITGNLRNTYFLFDDKLKVTTQLQGSIRNQLAPGTLAREEDTFFGSFTRDFDINPFSYALNTSRALRPRDNDGNLEYSRYNWAPFNIINEIDNNGLELNVADIKFQGQAEYKINDNLNYNFLGSARYVTSNGEQSATENSNVAAAYRADETTIVQDQNTFLFTDPDAPNSRPRVVLPVGGILTTTKNTLVTYTFRNTLDYTKRFKDDIHGIRIYGGQEYRYTDRSQSSNTGYGYQFSRGGTVFTDPDILKKAILEGNDYFSFQETRQREVSFFANVTYDFDKKYVLNVTGNYEGSNRAGKSSDTRWLPTYTIGAKWNIDKEDFIRNSNVISSMAFRPSYGLVALLADNATNNLAVFRNQITDRLNNDDRENFIDIEDLQNSELTWEKTLELNLGLDIGFFNNRIMMNFDAYFRKGQDLIDIIRTTGIGGESLKLGNNSEMTTNGIEFQLNTVNVDTDNFSWKTGFNISHFDQEVTSLKQQANVFDLITGTGRGNAVGFPKGSLFSFKFEGLNEWGLPQFLTDDPDFNPSDPYALIDFQDTDDVLDYLVYEGGTEPNVSGGLANSFKYKNWDFSFFVSFSAGNKIRLNPAYRSEYTDLDVFPREFVNRWTAPGDENITNIPAIPSKAVLQSFGDTDLEQAYNAYNYSTERVADGGFVRMKNITLGYSFDKLTLDKIGLSSFRLSLQSTNPFLIYSDSKLGGQDPEFFRSGGVAYPISRLFAFSLNVGF